MGEQALGPAQRRIVEHLKRSGPCTTAALASALGVTTQAVRPPLAELEDRRFVVAETVSTGTRGRPPLGWALSPRAIELFPDRHRDLAVELLDAMRTTLGDAALGQVLAQRDLNQRQVIEAELGPDADIVTRVEVLARVRREQGYMAEVTEADGHLILTEHHCPVCAAANECEGLCTNELEFFRDVIGPGATVERTSHLLSGDERCVYRIQLD